MLCGACAFHALLMLYRKIICAKKLLNDVKGLCVFTPTCAAKFPKKKRSNKSVMANLFCAHYRVNNFWLIIIILVAYI